MLPASCPFEPGAVRSSACLVTGGGPNRDEWARYLPDRDFRGIVCRDVMRRALTQELLPRRRGLRTGASLARSDGRPALPTGVVARVLASWTQDGSWLLEVSAAG
jgi:hypothetical protein